ncbi:aldo/keto reductase [Reyranella sp.]|uniref:aldo/keto reductase n=1 Tax=Reyranella sp. TaxID=1929291 RepID=UPI0027277076|nr:aldo/keto reductase [Reyranella sp.]MDO8976669.1 aldo/keto reductase [Reyranella sp.]
MGETGIMVSEVGFGAWGIGGRTAGATSYGDTDDAQSLSALHRALDLGITFFDTSSAYGAGHSEALIGRAVAGRRDKAVIATKAGYDDWTKPPDFSPAAIRRSAELSLKRLGTDYLDVLQLHNPPSDVLTAGETREVLAALLAEGKIRSWGVSAKNPAGAVEALRVMGAPIVQANFNMMDVRVVTEGLLEEVLRRGAAFIARTPLCFGFLTGTIDRTTVFAAGDHRAAWSRAQLDNWIDGARDLLSAVSANPGREAVLGALRFCLSFDGVSSVIPGVLHPAEAETNAEASGQGALPADVVEKVLAINAQRSFFVSPARAS